VQDPEIHLNDLGISVPCPVDPGQSAVLDRDHRVFVNWETYYLSSPAAMAVFLAAPFAYTGKVTDPVTRSRFEPTADSPRQDHAGRLFFFRSGSAAGQFAAQPDSFATPMITMRAH